MLDQILEQQDINFDLFIQRENLVGKLTGWRKLKSHARKSKILSGRNKILGFVLDR